MSLLGLQFVHCYFNLTLLTEPTVLIGRCSTQEFALSAYKCQREMITKLAEEDSATCR